MKTIEHNGKLYPDISGAVWEMKEKKISSYPVRSNWASQLGDKCERSLVFHRTHWREKQKHNTTLQFIFDEGHIQERAVKSDLMECGFEVFESERALDMDKYQIGGRIDGKIIGPDKIKYPVEIKSCSPYVFDKLGSFNQFQYWEAIEFASKTFPHLLRYPAQMQLYLLDSEENTGIVIFKNKTNGLLKIFYVDLDYEYTEIILKKAERINKCVHLFKGLSEEEQKKKENIDKIFPAQISDRDHCKGCGYNHICLPDIDWGSPLKMEDDPEFESKIDNWFKRKMENADFKKLDEDIREKCKSRENVVLGKYHITGKEDARGAWRKKIEVIK